MQALSNSCEVRNLEGTKETRNAEKAPKKTRNAEYQEKEKILLWEQLMVLRAQSAHRRSRRNKKRLRSCAGRNVRHNLIEYEFCIFVSCLIRCALGVETLNLPWADYNSSRALHVRLSRARGARQGQS